MNIGRSANRLFEPVDIAWLVFFRIAFGAIMLWESMLYIAQDKIKHLFLTPVFFFTYFGFEWVKPWPGLGMYIHFYAMAALSLGILFGLWYRPAAILFFLAFTYQFLLDQANYLNHFYLISLISFLMIFLPANRAFSLDALRQPELKSETAPAWTLWLMRLQIGIPYFYGGLAKFNEDWFRGWPLKTWLPPMNHLPFIGPWLSEEWVAIFFSYNGLLLDLLIVPALLWKRTRVLAFLAACVFHLLNAWVWHIGIFPWFMIPATLIFFSPSFPRHMLNWLGWKVNAFVPPAPQLDSREKHAGMTKVGSSPHSFSGDQQKRNRLTLILLGLYAAFQLLYPFRHLLYPGKVDWTEEGHMFSWRMKLRDKQPLKIEFIARNPQTGQKWNVNAFDLLMQRQVYKMSMCPDMILQFAHYAAKRVKDQGGFESIEVRAHVVNTLNSRKPQPMINPTVDLASVRRSYFHQKWVLPLKQPAREFWLGRNTSPEEEARRLRLEMKTYPVTATSGVKK